MNMSNASTENHPVICSLAEEMAKRPPSDWVLAMHEHFERTGSYRPEDLYRLLGDQNKGVSMDGKCPFMESE